MVTVSDVNSRSAAARSAFRTHADAMGTLIRNSGSLSVEMCRWMSMNVSVFDDVAFALATGAPDPDAALQSRVASAVAALREGDRALAGAFETAMIEGLCAAILLRMARADGATENGRRALQLVLDTASTALVPRIVDLGMAARAKRGRLSRMAAALGERLLGPVGLSGRAVPLFGSSLRTPFPAQAAYLAPDRASPAGAPANEARPARGSVLVPPR